jgi:hypothetical protein
MLVFALWAAVVLPAHLPRAMQNLVAAWLTCALGLAILASMLWAPRVRLVLRFLCMLQGYLTLHVHGSVMLATRRWSCLTMEVEYAVLAPEERSLLALVTLVCPAAIMHLPIPFLFWHQFHTDVLGFVMQDIIQARDPVYHVDPGFPKTQSLQIKASVHSHAIMDITCLVKFAGFARMQLQ